MYRIMFLCTGNAFRSQMAEGYARHFGGRLLEVHSAGVAPIGVSPYAVKVMAEDGINISAQSSDPIDPELLAGMDLVVTLCGNAEAACPATPPRIRRMHWPVEDPYFASGTEEEILAVNRKTRDDVKRRVKALVGSLKKEGVL